MERPINTKKAFDKIQHSFFVKTLSSRGIQKNLHDLKKSFYQPNITFNVAVLKLSEMRNQECHLPSFL